MASCRQVDIWMQAYLDNELRHADKLVFEQHVANCNPCARQLNQHKQASALLYESLREKRLYMDITPQVLGHLPEMDLTQTLATETTWRTKNPHRLTQLFFQWLPVFVPILLLVFGLALYYAWPNDEFHSEHVVGMVLQADGPAHWSREMDLMRRDVRLEQWINQADRFETGATSQLLLALAGPTQVAMDQASRIKIDDARRITVESGRIWLDVGPEDRYFQVITPSARIIVFGTRFEVAVDLQETVITVASGEVQVENEHSFAVLREGDRARVTLRNSMERDSVSRPERIARWAQEIQANPDAEAVFAATLPPRNGVVVNAEQVFVVDKRDHRIRAIRLRWEPTMQDAENPGEGYHLYIADDRMEPVYKHHLPGTLFRQAGNHSIEVDLPDNKILQNARILHIKLIPEDIQRKTDLTFSEIAVIGY